jgi:glucose-1-phosphate thymidylyltransferase
MKGIILAGGAGTRLHPLTLTLSKQLLPVYDKPLIYYPLSALMLAGIRDVLFISTARDLPSFRALFGDGASLGMRFAYTEQPRPEGIAQALIIADPFLAGSSSCLVLGDNIFFGNELGRMVRDAARLERGAQIFAYRVRDPERYGVIELDDRGRAVSLEEKPAKPKSHWAVPGLYFYGPDGPAVARGVRPSPRGELEITDLNRAYLERGDLVVGLLGRGIAWFDTGTHRSLLDAANFIASVEERQGLQVACLEEIAYSNGWIDRDQIRARLSALGRSAYTDHLRELLEEGA